MGGVHASPGDYEEPQLPEGVIEVRLSVYKLGLTGVNLLDSVGASIAGAYHSAVVFAGEEWSFGGHDDETKTGVYRSQPELNDEYIFYRRIIMGRVEMSPTEAVRKARTLANNQKWCGASYDLIERNCNHFASDLCWLLAKRRPPDWVNETAETLGKQRRRRRAKESALVQGMLDYRVQFGTSKSSRKEPDGESQSQDAPGQTAFRDTFNTTFDMAMDRRHQEGECQPGEDPLAFRLKQEELALDDAEASALAAAWVVAAAARAAAVARAAQPAAGLHEWDAAWMKHSRPLLHRWREDALQGRLTALGTAEREEEVNKALAIAAVEAVEAAQAAEDARVPPSPEPETHTTEDAHQFVFVNSSSTYADMEVLQDEKLPCPMR